MLLISNKTLACTQSGFFIVDSDMLLSFKSDVINIPRSKVEQSKKLVSGCGDREKGANNGRMLRAFNHCRTSELWRLNREYMRVLQYYC